MGGIGASLGMSPAPHLSPAAYNAVRADDPFAEVYHPPAAAGGGDERRMSSGGGGGGGGDRRASLGGQVASSVAPQHSLV